MARLGAMSRGQVRRWELTRQRMKREIRRLTKEAQGVFIDQEMPEIFHEGLRMGSGNSAYKLTQADKASIRRQRAKARTAMDAANVSARQRTNMTWRNARNFAHEEVTDVQGRNATRLLSVKYKDPRKNVPYRQVPYGVHQNMVLRTQAQASYNLGVIRGASSVGAQAFEIVDGPGCGLDSHEGSPAANGLIVSGNDARRYLLAHPNCTRTFVPRPDLEQPDPIKGRLARAAQAVRNQASTSLKSEAVQLQLRNLALDLALDAEMRRAVFVSARTATKSLRDLQSRIDQYLVRRRLADAPDFTEEELLELASDQIDEFLETGNVDAVSDWLRFILLADRPVKTIELQKAAGDFDYYRELTIRADMTHRELNILNAIEETYGAQVIKNVARFFPEADDLAFSYNAFLQKYTPSAYSGLHSHRLPDRIRNRMLSNVFKRFQDQTTNRLAEAINTSGIVGPGNVSFPRLGRYLDRKDLFGVRYLWVDRVLKVESTVVNKWRHFDKNHLVKLVVLRRGTPNTVKRYLKGESTVFENVMRKQTRQELIRWLGYRPGLLQHYTINPQGLVRLGFRFDPAYGWRRPLPVFSIVPKSTPLRYRARLNRGRLVGASEAEGIEGIRVRSITQELYITTGRTLNANAIPGVDLGTFAPGINKFGVRFKTILNQINDEIYALNSADDLKLLIQNLGVNGLKRQTEFMGAFMEMRAMGFSWLRIGRTLSLNPEEVALAARVFRAWFGANWRAELRAWTFMTQAQRMMLQGADPDDTLNMLQRALAELPHRDSDFSIARNYRLVEDGAGNLTTVRRRGFTLVANEAQRGQFIFNIRRDAQKLFDELADLYESMGSNVKIGRFGERIDEGEILELGIEDLQEFANRTWDRILDHRWFSWAKGIRPERLTGLRFRRGDTIYDVEVDFNDPRARNGDGILELIPTDEPGVFKARIFKTDRIKGEMGRALRNVFPRLEAKYPGIAERIGSIEDGFGWRGASYGSTASNNVDHITGYPISDIKMAFHPNANGWKYALDYRKGQYSTPGMGEATVVHEFGHAFHMTLDDYGRFVNGTIAPIRTMFLDEPFPWTHLPVAFRPQYRTSHTAKIVVDSVEEFLDARGIKMVTSDDSIMGKMVIQEQLGVYATGNWAEAFAEAFAQYELLGNRASPLAKLIVGRAINLLDYYEKTIRFDEVFDLRWFFTPKD